MLHEAPGEEVTQAGEPGMSSLFCYNVHASGGWLESGDIGQVDGGMVPIIEWFVARLCSHQDRLQLCPL